MKRWYKRMSRTTAAAAFAAASAVAATALAESSDVTSERIRNADKQPGDWLTYHRDYKGWQYSPLDQVNSKNVDKLRVAWTHVMPRSVRGLQSMPLAVDGVESVVLGVDSQFGLMCFTERVGRLCFVLHRS